MRFNSHGDALKDLGSSAGTLACAKILSGTHLEIQDNLIYLFMSRHEVHGMNIHTLQNAG